MSYQLSTLNHLFGKIKLVNKRVRTVDKRELSGKFKRLEARLELPNDGVTKADKRREFPICNKGDPGIITVIFQGNVEHTIKAYDPGYMPNPFSDFMSRIT